MCIVAKACGAVGPLGKNPVVLEPVGKTYAWECIIIYVGMGLAKTMKMGILRSKIGHFLRDR